MKVGAAIGPAAGPAIERLCAIINDGERNAVIRRYDIKHVVFKFSLLMHWTMSVPAALEQLL